QMIRPLRDEVERYGHYSLAAESMYDHPFQWGSKRTGPDLARVGGRYSDEWHVDHLKDPKALVPESVMPKYGFLSKTNLDYKLIKDTLKTNRIVGVPYTDDQIENAKQDLETQAELDGDHLDGFEARYKKASARVWDNDPNRITEMDALVAYLQMLGTLVDFDLYDANANKR
ncbi:MAG: cytochrome-c oxidase, cbb3-type subunit II, partial [Rhizobiales bacterium]|nr:cytochrome-c oxidase, cbb3-type subunit II [Hyphomicrobiales bacterium]